MRLCLKLFILATRDLLDHQLFSIPLQTPGPTSLPPKNLPKTAMHFLELPREIRDKTYEYLLFIDTPYKHPEDASAQQLCLKKTYPEEFMQPVSMYPTGLYKPFSYVDMLWTVGEDQPSDHYTSTIKNHKFRPIMQINRQTREEVLSLYIHMNLFIGLEGAKSIPALNQFAKLNQTLTSSIRILYVGVRTRVSPRPSPLTEEEESEQDGFPGDLAYFAHQNPSTWTDDQNLAYAQCQTNIWFRKTSRKPGEPWTIDEYTADGMATFKLCITDEGRALEIRTPFSLIPEQVDLIRNYIQTIFSEQKVGFDGLDLVKLAVWLRSRDTCEEWRYGHTYEESVIDRFVWELEVEKDEVEFFERDGLSGRVEEYYGPKRAFWHVVVRINTEEKDAPSECV
jgi:hypothetical protein